MAKPVTRLNNIVGLKTDPDISERLHLLEHRGQLERIELDRQDLARHRLRARTDLGEECIIVLPRSERLQNGAVLMLEDDRAIVVSMREDQWLSLLPRDTAAALELGYFAGNMHWRIVFDGSQLKVALDGPEESYLDRLAPMLADHRVTRTNDE